MSLDYRLLAAALSLFLAVKVPLDAQTPEPGAQQGSASASEDDFFDPASFDQTLTEAGRDDEENRLAYQFNLSFVSDTVLRLPVGAWNYAADSSFYGRAGLKAKKPGLGDITLAYVFRHYLAAGASNPGWASLYAARQMNSTLPQYQLSELFFGFDIGRVLFLRIGNQLVGWGPSFFWTPVDFVNLERQDAQAAVDVRSGKPGMRAHLLLDKVNVFLFADLSRSIQNYQVGDLYQTAAFAGRIDTVLGGAEWGLSGYFGNGIANKAGFDVSGKLGPADVYAEVAATVPLGGYSMSWMASGGAAISWGTEQEFGLRAELFWNEAGVWNKDLMVNSVFTPFYHGALYAFAELSWKKIVARSIDASLSATANLSDQSWQGALSFLLNLDRLPPVTFYVRQSAGPDNREFTVRSGATFTAGIRMSVEL